MTKRLTLKGSEKPAAPPAGCRGITGVWSRVFAGLLTCALLTIGFRGHAALYTYNVNSTIADNSIIGVTDSHTISGLGPVLTDITLTVNITGGWNGDLY